MDRWLLAGMAVGCVAVAVAIAIGWWLGLVTYG